MQKKTSLQVKNNQIFEEYNHNRRDNKWNKLYQTNQNGTGQIKKLKEA